MFILTICILHTKTKDIKIALLVSLIIIIFRIFYRYNTYSKIIKNSVSIENTLTFIIGLKCIYILTEYFKDKVYLVNNGLFIIIAYLCGSVFEWLIHYYIMHCYQNWESLLTYKNPIFKRMQKSCINHQNHHISVNNDMSIKEVKKKENYCLVGLHY